jgi:hypothetical protein
MTLARSSHVKNATAKTLRETAVKIASPKSYLATDENPAYTKARQRIFWPRNRESLSE